ncbi:MAG TPA: hypothetical protein VMP68_29820, partial [Candidatus Eisenbacteria bacterium]|nr:hypothetical protein [Candidatus Eisenbacteria bacterium]
MLPLLQKRSPVQHFSWIPVILAMVFICGLIPASAQDDPLHIWAGKLDRPGAEKWVANHLSREQKFVDELLTVKGTRTIANTLRPFDDATNELTVAGAESYLMFAVAP